MNSQYSNSCGCKNPNMPPASPCDGMPSYGSGKSLAMAYVPWQTWQNVSDGCNGLKQGTIFDDLVLSFHGTKAACAPYPRPDRRYNNNNYYRRGM